MRKHHLNETIVEAADRHLLRARKNGCDGICLTVALEPSARGVRQVTATACRMADRPSFRINKQAVPHAQFALPLDFSANDEVFVALEALGMDKARAVEACRAAVALVRGTSTVRPTVEGFFLGFKKWGGPWKLRAV